MDQSTRQPKLLKDYAPPNYLADAVELDFALDPKATRVKSKLRLRRNP
jgi:aminopeptidase N